MPIVTKRTVMSLYSSPDDIYSHQVRIVLAEKGVNVEIMLVNGAESTPELLAVNPYDSVPTLIDRELVLYEAGIIMEYLDERFPHPPLLPVYPVARAESRKMMYRIERDWYTLMKKIQANETPETVQMAIEALMASVIGLEPLFKDKPYFLNEDFSLLDCVIAPFFWRLPQLGVDIPAECAGLHEYMQRVFKRPAFQTSLTDMEKQVRVA